MGHKLNLKGVLCPLNYVKTKLKLEELKSGDLLEVILDDDEALKNVPSSIRQDGHQILAINQAEDSWIVIIRKK